MEVEVGVSEPTPTPDVAIMRNGQVQVFDPRLERRLYWYQCNYSSLPIIKYVCNKLSSAVATGVLQISLLGGNKRLKLAVLCFVCLFCMTQSTLLQQFGNTISPD